jgi:hypothetical protein
VSLGIEEVLSKLTIWDLKQPAGASCGDVTELITLNS